MVKKIKALYAFSAFILVTLMTIGVVSATELDPDPDGRDCITNGTKNGICRTQTSGGTTKKICVDLLEGETADCTKPTLEP